MRAEYNLPYPAGDGSELLFDRFAPESGGQLPAVVVIHGGGWISGDRSMMTDVGVSLAAQGFAAFCPNYRLAPLHPFPSAIRDVQSFVRFLRKDAESFGIDPNAIASLGNSAGGHLASMLGVTDESAEGLSSRVNSVVAICPITDLTNPTQQHLPIAMAFLEQFMGCNAMESPEKWQDASPVTHVSASSAPHLIIHGTSDDIVPSEQSRSLHAALKAYGVACSHHELPGEGHSFTYSGWTRIEQLFGNFLAETLRGERIA